jgi:hypothetical protein
LTWVRLIQCSLDYRSEAWLFPQTLRQIIRDQQITRGLRAQPSSTRRAHIVAMQCKGAGRTHDHES